MLGMCSPLPVMHTPANKSQLILPFFIAIYLIITHQYMLDPLIAIAGYSEYTLFDFNKIREKFVLKTLRRRAFTVLGLFAIILAG